MSRHRCSCPSHPARVHHACFRCVSVKVARAHERHLIEGADIDCLLCEIAAERVYGFR